VLTLAILQGRQGLVCEARYAGKANCSSYVMFFRMEKYQGEANWTVAGSTSSAVEVACPSHEEAMAAGGGGGRAGGGGVAAAGGRSD
jgi:hypothetical protein